MAGWTHFNVMASNWPLTRLKQFGPPLSTKFASSIGVCISALVACTAGALHCALFNGKRRWSIGV